MDIATFSEQLQKQLKEQVEWVNASIPDPLANAARMIAISGELVADLQQFTYNYKFISQEEEIRFFKEIKPVLLSNYYYYRRLFSIHLYVSYKDVESRKKLYEQELQRMERYARKNNDFFLYCMTGQTYLDDKYFTRKSKTFAHLLDIQFSTGFDEKLARMLAHEVLKASLLAMQKKATLSENYATLNWTGNKTDAAELLLAIHASGNVNNGEAEIKQLIELFEELFNIRFGNYYDTLKKIRMRKGNRANFIEKLKDKLLLRLDEMEG